MKSTTNVPRSSRFWSRLLGTLIAFAIVALLVYGGVSNLMSELSAAHDALAASQYELGRTQVALDNVRAELVVRDNALHRAATEVDRMGRRLEMSQQQLQSAQSHINTLQHAGNQLAQRWRHTVQELGLRTDQLAAKEQALLAKQAELDELQNRPQWSVIVTNERQMQQSYREYQAMSHARMFIEGDRGAMYYEGMVAERQVEQYASFAERTQVILTTTAPGQDVLRCLQNASLGCGTVVAAKAQAVQMGVYAYEAQFQSQEMLLVDGRRGRHPRRGR